MQQSSQPKKCAKIDLPNPSYKLKLKVDYWGYVKDLGKRQFQTLIGINVVNMKNKNKNYHKYFKY